MWLASGYNKHTHTYTHRRTHTYAHILILIECCIMIITSNNKRVFLAQYYRKAG